jgi:hypothetical protein
MITQNRVVNNERTINYIVGCYKKEKLLITLRTIMFKGLYYKYLDL